MHDDRCEHTGSADAKTRATIQSITVTPLDDVKKGGQVTVAAKFTLSKYIAKTCMHVIMQL